MSIVVARGFVLRNGTGRDLEVNVYNQNDESQMAKIAVRANSYSEGKLLNGFSADSVLRFEVLISGEDFPAIVLGEIRYNKNGDAFVVGINELSNTFVFGPEGTGYTRGHFYNSAAVVSSFEVHLYPGGDQLWESSDKPVGQSADVDFKTLGLKDLSMLTFNADVNWGDDSDAGPILYSKTGDKTAGFELKGTAFKTWLNQTS